MNDLDIEVHETVLEKKTRLSANIALITTAISSINTKNSQSYFQLVFCFFFFFLLYEREKLQIYIVS